MNNAQLTGIRNLATAPAQYRIGGNSGLRTGSPKRFWVEQFVPGKGYRMVAGPFGTMSAAQEAASVLRSR